MSVVTVAWLLLSGQCGQTYAQDKKPEASAPTVSAVYPPGSAVGQTTKVKLTNSVGSPVGKFWSDRGQLSVKLEEDGKSAKVIVPAEATPGLHWFRCYNGEGASPRIPFVVGIVSELQEAEPNNRPSEANPLAEPSQTVNGVIEKSGDVDVFQLSLEAGQTVVLSVLANRTLGSPMDAVLQVVDANGTVLAHNDDDHGLDPELAFTASEAGDYFARLFAFPSNPNSTIRLAGAATYVYRLTATREAFVDYATPAAVDGAPESRVRLTGWNLPDKLQTVTVSPLRPESFLVSDGVTLPVQIRRSALPSFSEDECPAPIRPPFVIGGVISVPAESDEFCFPARKGERYSFSVAAFKNDSSLDAVLCVVDSKGKVLKTADDIARDNFDCSLTFTMPADDTYTVRIFDRFASGSERHFYELTVVSVKPQMNASVPNDAIVLSGEKEQEVTVTVERVNGHAEDVEFALRGLPDGVDCQPVVSQSKGDSAKKVVLKLSKSAAAQPFSGMVRIVGSGKSTQVPVLLKLPNNTGTTDSIWLTVK